MDAPVMDDNARAMTRLSAGRIRAMEIAPYLSMALLALEPIPKPGMGTFAVDSKWRIYYDPALCLKWTIDEIAAVWLHEMNHVFRDHAKRFQRFNDPATHRDWNVSADAAINSDLRDMNVVLPSPDTRYYATPSGENPNWKQGMTAEEMYRARTGFSGATGEEQEDEGGGSGDAEEKLPKGAEDPDDKVLRINPSGDGEPEESNDSDEESSEEEEGDDGESSPGEGGGGDDESEEDGSGGSGGSGEGEGDPDEEVSASGQSEPGEEDSEGEDGEGTPGDGEPGDGSSESSGEGEGEPGEGNGEPGEDHDDHEGAPHGDCGSGADGIKREFENVDDREYPGIDEGRVDIIKQEVARAIVDYDNSHPGTVPGGMRRTADEVLKPEADWERVLLAKVRRIVAHIAGKADYSYSRPSRRQGNSAFIFPALRGGTQPIIYIIIDTSGSMEPRDLARALSEIAEIIRRARGKVYVVICDSATKGEVTLVKRLEDIELIGGGGTDMRVGIRLAAGSKPRPDIILTITDGYTPWIKVPEEMAPRATYLALIVTPKNKKDGAPIKQVPDFMNAIVVSH